MFILVARILRFFSDISWFSDCKQGTSLDDVDINLVLNGTTTKLLFKLVAYISLVLKVAFWLAWQLLVTFGHTKETGREVIKALLPRWHRKISTFTTFSYIFLLPFSTFQLGGIWACINEWSFACSTWKEGSQRLWFKTCTSTIT